MVIPGTPLHRKIYMSISLVRIFNWPSSIIRQMGVIILLWCIIPSPHPSYGRLQIAIPMIRDYDYLFKVVIVGNSSVGKSALLRRFADDTFQQSYLATIGVDFRFKTITVDGNIAKLQIWDTAGQQQFRTITSTYYRGAHGILMVYDVTNQKSFEDIKNFWLKEVENYAEPNAKLALIGNKSDCGNREVSGQDLASYADSKSIPGYEVSAKTGEGVDKIFAELSRELVKIHPKVNPVAVKNPVMEDLKKRKGDMDKRKNEFKIRSGADTVAKEKGCCG